MRRLFIFTLLDVCALWKLWNTRAEAAPSEAGPAEFGWRLPFELLEAQQRGLVFVGVCQGQGLTLSFFRFSIVVCGLVLAIPTQCLLNYITLGDVGSCSKVLVDAGEEESCLEPLGQ